MLWTSFPPRSASPWLARLPESWTMIVRTGSFPRGLGRRGKLVRGAPERRKRGPERKDESGRGRTGGAGRLRSMNSPRKTERESRSSLKEKWALVRAEGTRSASDKTVPPRRNRRREGQVWGGDCLKRRSWREKRRRGDRSFSWGR